MLYIAWENEMAYLDRTKSSNEQISTFRGFFKMPSLPWFKENHFGRAKAENDRTLIKTWQRGSVVRVGDLNAEDPGSNPRLGLLNEFVLGENGRASCRERV